MFLYSKVGSVKGLGVIRLCISPSAAAISKLIFVNHPGIRPLGILLVE